MSAVGVVIVAYRSGEELWNCCEAVAISDLVAEVIVVDNGHDSPLSSAATTERLRSKLQIIGNGDNLGYAEGNNLGIRQALQDGLTHVLVCNPDVVIREGALRQLVDEMAQRNLDLISPRLIEADSNGASSTLSEPGWDLLAGRGVLSRGGGVSKSSFFPTFFGACFLATSALFQTIGLLSPNLFLFCEEVDYCLRMSRGDRFAWAISSTTTAEHGRGASVSPGGYSARGRSSISVEHAARSAIVVGRMYWPIRVPMWVALRMALAAKYAAMGRLQLAAPVVRGLWSGLRAKIAEPEAFGD